MAHERVPLPPLYPVIPQLPLAFLLESRPAYSFGYIFHIHHRGRLHYCHWEEVRHTRTMVDDACRLCVHLYFSYFIKHSFWWVEHRIRARRPTNVQMVRGASLPRISYPYNRVRREGVDCGAMYSVDVDCRHITSFRTALHPRPRDVIPTVNLRLRCGRRA